MPREIQDRFDTAREALANYAKYRNPDPAEERAWVARSIAGRDMAKNTMGVLNRYTVGKPILTPEDINRVASEAISEKHIRSIQDTEENYEDG